MRSIVGRLGSFFIIVGLVLWVIFFTTDQASQPSYGYLINGAAALFLGVYLWWHSREPAPESGRFRAIRRLSQKSAERKARSKQDGDDELTS